MNYTAYGLSSLEEVAHLLFLGNTSVVLLTDGSDMFCEDGVWYLKMRMFDPGQQKVTVQQTILLDRGNGYCSTISLACYETLYLDNTAYFDAILN